VVASRRCRLPGDGLGGEGMAHALLMGVATDCRGGDREPLGDAPEATALLRNSNYALPQVNRVGFHVSSMHENKKCCNVGEIDYG